MRSPVSSTATRCGHLPISHLEHDIRKLGVHDPRPHTGITGWKPPLRSSASQPRVAPTVCILAIRRAPATSIEYVLHPEDQICIVVDNPYPMVCARDIPEYRADSFQSSPPPKIRRDDPEVIRPIHSPSKLRVISFGEYDVELTRDNTS